MYSAENEKYKEWKWNFFCNKKYIKNEQNDV